MPRIIAIRGCNLGRNTGVMREYKRALGAAMVTAPSCRMFYLPISVNQTNAQHSIAKVRAGAPFTGKTRRRIFEDPVDPRLRATGPLAIDIQDVDGHTRIRSVALMDHPGRAVDWAASFNGAWRQVANGAGAAQFTIQVMWDDRESSYHTGRDPSYASKLVSV